MYLYNRLDNKKDNSFFQKIKDLDFILLISILALGLISLATMYSTDGGQILFHTKSHFSKFVIFTLLMLTVSFFNIRFWFSLSYIIYIVIIFKNFLSFINFYFFYALKSF